MPLPEVSVTALNQHVGSPLSLRCVVTTVKGITSGVDIIWKVNNTEIIERYDGNITEKRTSYVYYYNANTNLTVDDNNTVYQCQVIINASPLISNADNLTLNIIGRYRSTYMHVIVNYISHLQHLLILLLHHQAMLL